MNEENTKFLDYLDSLSSRLHPLACIPIHEVMGIIKIESKLKEIMVKLREGFPSYVKEEEK